MCHRDFSLSPAVFSCIYSSPLLLIVSCFPSIPAFFLFHFSSIPLSSFFPVLAHRPAAVSLVKRGLNEPWWLTACVCVCAHQSRMEKQIGFFSLISLLPCEIFQATVRTLLCHSCPLKQTHGRMCVCVCVCECVCWHVSKCMFSCVNCSSGRDNEFCHVSVWMNVCLVSEIRGVTSSAVKWLHRELQTNAVSLYNHRTQTALTFVYFSETFTSCSSPIYLVLALAVALVSHPLWPCTHESLFVGVNPGSQGFPASADPVWPKLFTEVTTEILSNVWTFF